MIPLCDVQADNDAHQPQLLEAFRRVLESGCFIGGDEVAAFEQELASWTGAGFAVGVSSGTDALLCALAAAGVEGREVVTTPFTFMATASAIVRAGAQLRFSDIEADGFGLCPEALAQQISARTRAVVPVHLYGHPCRMARIAAVCTPDTLIIEDAAQALGSRVGGRAVGTLGQMGCISFFPAKNLGALGDGGMVLTDDPSLAQRLRLLRSHGAQAKHHHVLLGGNHRLDALQAAFLRCKLKALDEALARRKAHAAAYREAFATISELRLPPANTEHDCAFGLFTLRIPDGRPRLQEHLAQRGVATQIHYPKPLHLQPALRHLGYAPGDFPNSERAAEEVLSIPLFPRLTEFQRQEVIASVRSFFLG